MKFDLPHPKSQKASAGSIVLVIDGIAEGCLGIGTAVMVLTLIYWPGMTDPGLSRTIALFFFSPIVVGGGFWGICRLLYRKRFEFRLKSRELHVEERSFFEGSTHEVVPFESIHIETRRDELDVRRGTLVGYFSLVEYGRKPLALDFSKSLSEAEIASDAFSRDTGISIQAPQVSLSRDFRF